MKSGYLSQYFRQIAWKHLSAVDAARAVIPNNS